MEAPPRLSQTQAPGGVFLVFVFFLFKANGPQIQNGTNKKRETKPNPSG